MSMRFKAATEPHEFEQIHRLNYRTFVEEIPQHAANEHQMLIDGRCAGSTFFVALRGERVVGMIAISDQRPFSLDAKLPHLDALLPDARSICEIRLLAVEPGERTGVVFRGLAEQLARHCLQRRHDLAVISGTVRQLRLYTHLGFQPFGPRVGTAAAEYQPMYMTLDALRGVERTLFKRAGERVSPEQPAYFVPGPVQPTAAVAAAMAEPARSHRDPCVLDVVRRVRARLCAMTGAPYVTPLLGSGTLANDVVAAQLVGAGHGIVFSHGEFGERLADHAARWRLDHAVVRLPWGDAFAAEDFAAVLDSAPHTRWIWFALCETSSGVLTDLPGVRAVCAARDVRVCVDAVSALGTIPVDLSEVHLASAVSTKGLGAPPGIALVFHSCRVPLRTDVPRYLDLSLYANDAALPFTQSSALFGALDVALAHFDDADAVYRATAADGAWVRGALVRSGFRVIASAAAASPAVITIDLGSPGHAALVGSELERQGFLTGWRSGYLQGRGWLQFALMGQYRRLCLGGLVAALRAAAAQATDLPRSA